jgi:hypothetical protein
VPVRYHNTFLSISICCILGFLVKDASLCVAKEMSGRIAFAMYYGLSVNGILYLCHQYIPQVDINRCFPVIYHLDKRLLHPSEISIGLYLVPSLIVFL